MGAVERLNTALATPQGEARWLSWFEQDMTQLVLAALRERARPRRCEPPDALTVAVEHGRLHGYAECDDLIARPGAAARAAEDPLSKLVPRYETEATEGGKSV